MWACKSPHHHEEYKGYTNTAVYTFSAASDLYNHILLQHDYNSASSDDAEIWDLVRQSELDGLSPLALCPLCSFLEGTSMEETKFGTSSEPKKDSAKGGVLQASQPKKPSPRKKAGVTFGPEVQLPRDNLPSDKNDIKVVDSPSTSFSLGHHIAAHLHFLMVLSLRLMTTQEISQDDDDNDAKSLSVASATNTSQQTKPDAEEVLDSDLPSPPNGSPVLSSTEATQQEVPDAEDTSWSLVRPEIYTRESERQDPVQDEAGQLDHDFGDTELLDQALQRLTDEERVTIKKYIPAAKDNTPLQGILAAAKRNQSICEEKELKVITLGRNLMLKDSAERIIKWLEILTMSTEVVVNAYAVEGNIPWTGVGMLLQVFELLRPCFCVIAQFNLSNKK